MMSRTIVPPHGVTASAVLVLQSMKSYPSVSLLMPTRPGRLDAEQATELRALRDSVARRLDDEGLYGFDGMLAELDDLIDLAHEVPLERGLALYANESHAQLLVLPVDVRKRAVVDPTFATRDLVRALHRAPRHVVLTLAEQEARLLESQAGALRAADTTKFPMVAGSEEGERGRSEHFLHRVDSALGAYLRLRPAPVVVVAPEPVLSRFVEASHNLARLAGTVAGHHLTTPPAELADLVAPQLERYLASRQDEALALVGQRRHQDRAALGLPAVWRAARWERPEMLAVEDDFFFPARISPDGDSLQAAVDVEHPDVIDDVVDELVEQIMARGGWVALVEPGRIPDGHRVALTTRGR